MQSWRIEWKEKCTLKILVEVKRNEPNVQKQLNLRNNLSAQTKKADETVHHQNKNVSIQ